MKINFKIFLALLLICISTEVVDAQTNKKRFTADVHFGLNFAGMDIKGANMYKTSKIGTNIGGNLNYKLFENIQVQTGFFVSKKGLRQHVDQRRDVDTGTNYVTIGDTLRNTTANYMQIPLALGYELYFTKNMAFNVNVGMYGAYGFKGKHKEEGYKTIVIDGEVQGTEIMPPKEEETFALRKWSRWDYGAIGSVGFIYDIYTINLNYEHGLRNIADDGRVLKNRDISILLGFRF